MMLQEFDSRYVNRELIGSGGFGDVYKAWDHVNRCHVAVKIANVRPSLSQYSLRNEVELINKYPKHRNIARYDFCLRFDLGVAGELDIAVLKYYGHGNLEQFLQRNNLDEYSRKKIIAGILDGVCFLESNNIIHRDLKAQNILLEFENGELTPVITDFGLSRNLNNNTLSVAKALSYAYAAPEQIRNERIYKNVDLWAVGVIIYRIVAGCLPFRSGRSNDDQSTNSQIEISRKIVNLELPPQLNDLPEPYQGMIRSCLVLDPNERVQSAADLLQMLNPTNQTKPTSSLTEQGNTHILPPGSTEESVSSNGTQIVEKSGLSFEKDQKSDGGDKNMDHSNHSHELPNDNSWTTWEQHPQVNPESDSDHSQIPMPPGQSIKWGYFLYPLLFIFLVLSALFGYQQLKRETVSPVLTGEYIRIHSLSELRNMNRDALDDTAKLKAVFELLNQHIQTTSPNYRQYVELAINRAYAGNGSTAIGALRMAAQIAIGQEQAQYMLAEIQGIMQNDNFSLASTKEWKAIVQALKRTDVTLLPAIPE